MKNPILILLIVIFSSAVFAQSDLEKLVETEKKFAARAIESSPKTAFLEFLAVDGVTFYPEPTNGIESWKSRPEDKTALVWSPEFADISANGVLGYTSGPWELRPNGKNDIPTSFGHYVTIWQKQQDGNFKVVLDIGISHAKTAIGGATKYAAGKAEPNEKRISAADVSTQFFEMADKESIEKAYKMFAADEIRFYRDGILPIANKKEALNSLKKVKTKIKFAKRSIFTSAGNLAYISNTYTRLDNSLKVVEKGNFVQIWKFQKGTWQIVLDLFTVIN